MHLSTESWCGSLWIQSEDRKEMSMKKISVMIVDDEKLVMEDLRTLVDWDALGFEITATAFNGRQALEKYRKYHPQVVFTDVKMPFMDGLELIKNLRECDHDAYIFLLTAYEDFTYARTAIKYGIKDYVIKSTLDEGTFTELLTNLARDIRQQNEFQDILKEKQILEFLEAPEGECKEEFRKMCEKAYSFVLIEQDLPLVFADDAVPDSYVCPRKEISSAVVMDSVPGCEVAAVSHTPEQRVLVVLESREVSQQKITEMTYRYAGQIQKRLKETLDASFTVYVIDQRITFAELKRIYRRNHAVFQKKYLTGCGGIFRLESETDRGTDGEEVTADTARIQEMIDRRDAGGIVKYLDEVYKELEESRNVKWLKSVSRELYALLKHNYKRLPNRSRREFKMTSDVREWLDSRYIEAWFSSQFQILVKQKEEIYHMEYSRPVVQAMEYIFRHYQEHTLTIKEIADQVYLSTGHLCGMFKKETGKTLNSYITEVRIEEAKRLLDEGEMKIYEVSLAVGYQSSQYFSQIFYKITGTYPTNWQKDSRRR